MIRDNVKDIREAKGVSASRVAKKLGLTPQGYYYIEGGQVELKAERLKVIAEFLREDVSVFFDRKLTESVLERIEGEVKCAK